MKTITVTCSQNVIYDYEIEIPDGVVDVEEYVYYYRLNCDELGESGVPLTRITDWGDVVVEDIREEE